MDYLNNGRFFGFSVSIVWIFRYLFVSLNSTNKSQNNFLVFLVSFQCFGVFCFVVLSEWGIWVLGQMCASREVWSSLIEHLHWKLIIIIQFAARIRPFLFTNTFFHRINMKFFTLAKPFYEKCTRFYQYDMLIMLDYELWFEYGSDTHKQKHYIWSYRQNQWNALFI